MTRRLRWARALALILVTAVVAGVGCSFIPDDEYLRYQLLDQSSQRGVRWVFERTHMNPAPIDVAIVGTSRTGAGIDAARLAQRLAADGAPATVVNFSLPEEGRDLHWVLAEQVLTRKHPAVLIVGVIEQPTRKSNPGFKFVAPARELADPGYLLNQDYLDHLAYLPYRQLLLLFARVAPDSVGMQRRFDPRRAMTGPGIWFIGQHADLTKAELEQRRRIFDRQVKPPSFGARYADLEFGNEATYVRKIAALAQRSGTKLVFLYMPHYGGPANVVRPTIYSPLGPLLSAGFIASQDAHYYNLAHLNPKGAAIVTDWLAPQIEPLLPHGTTGQRH